MMKKYIFYISSVCSPKTLNKIFENLSDKSGIAIQKYHRLLLEGFAFDKSNLVETLSTIPISPANHKRIYWKLKSDMEKGVRYNYIPIINLPFIKNIIVFFYSFFKFLFWKFPQNIDGKKIVICDVLSFTISTAAQLAFRIRDISIIGLITDIPGISVRNESAFKRVFNKIRIFSLKKYDGYILLTKQMNTIVNTRNKPFIIIEGICDHRMSKVDNIIRNKSHERILIYAGGLYERYGIKKLIQAFIRLEGSDLRLYLYGEGPMVHLIREFMNIDSRIIYKGVVANDVVVRDQIAATLLINPRPCLEEFSKFSFPSKNMEYMVSGTPLVTTLLPGIPEEYFSFVYLFKGESIEQIYLTLSELVNKPKEVLNQFGRNAKDFVLRKKNNIVQAAKIKDFFIHEI